MRGVKVPHGTRARSSGIAPLWAHGSALFFVLVIVSVLVLGRIGMNSYAGSDSTGNTSDQDHEYDHEHEADWAEGGSETAPYL